MKFKVKHPESAEVEILTETQMMVRFKHEGTRWLQSFIAQIRVQGFAYTWCGTRYELIKE